MLNKLVDLLKEVFWIKKTALRRKKGAVKKVAAKQKVVAKKKAARKKPAAKPKVKAQPKVTPKPPKAPKKPAIDPNLVPIGEITHYFDRIKVCVIKITAGSVLIGDKVTIVGPKTKFVQKVWSMQIESVDVKVAKKGQLIGVKVDKPVAAGDIVYK